MNFALASEHASDLVSYEAKHNEANGEGNRVGSDDYLSWNSGVEGPMDDPGLQALRERRRRTFLATLFVSQGVPMLCGVDEIGRTQQGNKQRLLPGQRDVVVRLGASRPVSAVAGAAR